MSSVENQMYGGSYETCTACGVKQRSQLLERKKVFVDAKQDPLCCKDAVECARWKALLEVATPADVDRCGHGAAKR